jgi:hypothetical protein
MKERWVFACFPYFPGKPHREHELQEFLCLSCRTETGRYLRVSGPNAKRSLPVEVKGRASDPAKLEREAEFLSLVKGRVSE